MEFEKTCVNCKTILHFTKKDIRPVNKKWLKKINEKNGELLEYINEKETGLLTRKEHFKHDLLVRLQAKAMIVIPYGMITCPICKTKQLIIKEI